MRLSTVLFPPFLLHKTNWPNFNSKFLVSAANIHWCDIYDRQPCHVLRSVLKDRLAHVAITFRTAVLKNSVSESAVSLRLDLQVIGPFQNDSFLEVLSLVIHVPNTVLTEVSDILGSFL